MTDTKTTTTRKTSMVDMTWCLLTSSSSFILLLIYVDDCFKPILYRCCTFSFFVPVEEELNKIKFGCCLCKYNKQQQRHCDGRYQVLVDICVLLRRICAELQTSLVKLSTVTCRYSYCNVRSRVLEYQYYR